MPRLVMASRSRSRPAARAFVSTVLAILAAGFAAEAPAQPCGGFRVLVFSKTTGFRHADQIKTGTALIKSLGSAHGFAVDATEDASRFTASNLGQYAAVVFLNTTGDVLDAAQQTAFESFVRRGGGLVGVHSAADTEYGWPFYGAALGAWFQSHPTIQSADVVAVDRTHPSTAHLPAKFSHRDEWYNFRTNPAKNKNIRVLLTLDEKTYSGGTMGSVHPIAWCQSVGAGRSWYTGLGHDLATYSAAFFQRHLLGGILFASGGTRQVTVTATQGYGSSSGTPAISLAARLQPTRVDLVIAGGGSSASALLLISLCATSDRFGPYTLLADARPGQFVALLPGSFDTTGRAVFPLPLTFRIPAAAGTSVFFQGAQTTPTLGLSNGLQVTLTPQ